VVDNRRVFILLAAAMVVIGVILVSELNHVPGRSIRVTSGSMRPTLGVGRILPLDTKAYSSNSPQVGDIVAFDAPAGAMPDKPVCGVSRPAGAVCPQPTAARSNELFVKRIVAGPGDTVSVLGGIVVRNGVAEHEPYIAPCGASQECNFPTPVQIPRGEWFVLGDDRGASNDSRNWGPIPANWIVGKVKTGP
jgi:signal peptidase I